ncbi:MAG: hypothetical protein QQW96_17810 [Tychonema bourrellyi B0820]|uniref:Uncharacterized protein n=1 Tax=Tychonema bourrellyi FEM_GT703 TaxID=2040638 RepID=A0A2G4F192_9CYAN|nr:hypothetical protein [Tychonema bourrellyi]MDQ2099490.1 hypothetical protein [Tychonema bourrellyi B0820]PHX55522.1 hypothetical protein CP500_010470 [Tychonema bourrellyi FEM_GT703]
MIISDLNYLESAEANVEGGYYFGPSSSTNVYADIRENLTINKVFNSVTKTQGTFAGAEATASALGANSATQAISNTVTIQGVGSTSNATSISGSNGNPVWHW